MTIEGVAHVSVCVLVMLLTFAVLVAGRMPAIEIRRTLSSVVLDVSLLALALGAVVRCTR